MCVMCGLQLSEFNRTSQPRLSESVSAVQWTNMQLTEPSFLIGDEVVGKLLLLFYSFCSFS